MTTYKLFHLEGKSDHAAAIRLGGRDASDEAIRAELLAGSYRFVAELKADNLDEVFARTQNIASSWTDSEIGLSPATLARGGARSTSVGDLIQTSDGEIVLVDGTGFIQVSVTD